MRDDWNEELRRAYDRGYWDARREFEHHLALDRRDHSGDRHRGEWERNESERHYGNGGYADVGNGGGYSGSQSGYEWNDDRGYGDNDRREWGSESHGSPGARYGYREDRYREERDRSGYRDYPPGDRRSYFEGHDNRGFLERAGETIGSWFGGGDDRRQEDYGRGERGGGEYDDREYRARAERGNLWW
jgi:hypothetical protein